VAAFCAYVGSFMSVPVFRPFDAVPCYYWPCHCLFPRVLQLNKSVFSVRSSDSPLSTLVMCVKL
jgi:hypothetical protein